MTRPLALAVLSGLLTACSSIPRAGEAPPPPLERLAVNRTELAFAQEGEGVPVVFLHPTAGDWRSFDLHRPAIADRYRYVAYSRRYHYPNASAGDGSDYTDQAHLADLVAFLRALDAGPVHLVGASSGAALALRAALQYPELVRSAVLDEPDLPSLIAALPEARAVAAEAAANLQARQAAARSGDLARAAELLALQRLPDDEVRRWSDNLRVLGLRAPAARPPALRCVDAARARVPILVLRGQRTIPYFQLVSDTLAGCLPPGTARELVPRAGHFNYLQEPAAFQRLVLPFLAKH